MKNSETIPQKAFIFIGRSGSGKGTQAKLLIEYLKKHDPARDVLYVQTGSEFRNFITNPSQTAKLANKVNEIGGLQPEFLAVYMWTNILTREYKENEHIIFDGTPRKLHEAGVLHSIFDFYTISKPCVVYMNVSGDWAKDKLLARKRHDDTEEDIKTRFSWFDNEVLPAVEFYRTNPYYNFIELNGEQDIMTTHVELLKRIFA